MSDHFGMLCVKEFKERMITMQDILQQTSSTTDAY